MHAPLYSTVTLLAEIVVSSAIYYTLYQGYKHNKFPVLIAAAALAYEIIFNISYMVSRVPANTKAAKVESLPIILLAILHGTLSLVMFVSLIVFFLFAWHSYRKKTNFFLTHKYMTGVFTVFWTLSVLSGILFFIFLYLI